MPVDERLKVLLAELPKEVVNELAILEDRALRAEDRATRCAARNGELVDEVMRLRNAVEELVAMAQGLERTIDDGLRHVLVVQAR